MDTIRKIYVEKKQGVDVEAVSILNDLRNNLGVLSLENVRLLNCYSVSAISDETYKKSLYTVFSEAPVDTLFEENFPKNQEDFVFAVKYLPGQFDQRASFAEQCLSLLLEAGSTETPFVETSKVYILSGIFSDADKLKIKKYIINPIDSCEVSLDSPKVMQDPIPSVQKIEVLDEFIELSEDEIEEFLKKYSLAMTKADLLLTQAYFRDEEKRNPTITEIKVLDTYWSDHCRHTTFLTEIEDVTIEDGVYSKPIKQGLKLYLTEKQNLSANKPITLMNIAQMGMKALKSRGLLDDLDESEEINACSIVAEIDVDGKAEEWLIMFKNETHNHPTEIEPYGGAATCLGGAIRDPLSGRSYVYQAMRVTGAKNPCEAIEDTIPGKLSQRKIVIDSAHGYSSYGNQIGLATGLVDEVYHDGYVAKRMEIGAVIGAAKRENVVREVPTAGDVVILVGGKTGRDGVGGATGSSKEQTEETLTTAGAEVQKGSPTEERKLQRLFRSPEISKMIKRCNDFGAGGVSVAIGELADGLRIDLSAVPLKYEGLTGTEIALSESQERMAVVVASSDAERFIKLSQEENLEATKVAEITEEKRLVMEHNGESIVNISREFLDTSGAKSYAKVHIATPKQKESKKITEGLHERFLSNLKDLNVCAKKGLSERFDSTVGSGTVLMPFGGKNQLTPALAMAAKVPVLYGETNSATIMSYGFDPVVSEWSPFHGAMCAVIDSINKIVATGGNPAKIRLSFQEYFEKLGEDAVKWGKPFSALLGALTAQIKLSAPSIGGKDSMSGSFKDIDVPPTLVSFAVNVALASDIISPEFKSAGNDIAVLYNFFDEEGMPDFDYLNKLNKIIHKLIVDKKIVSAHNIGRGGIASAVAKMAFGNDIGFNIDIEDENYLFMPNYGGFVIEITDELNIEEEFKDLEFEILGITTSDKNFVINGTEINQEEALKAWIMPLEEVFPTRIYDKETRASELKLYDNKERKTSSIKIAKPKVFIPVFPGTNCEYDTAKAFKKAGAETEFVIVKNLNIKDLEETIEKMASVIKSSQIIALPGGFSAADEPDGSAKFIANVFRNAKIKVAVEDLLNNRDGLMIGICNGFQALIKLGLVPFGEITDFTENSPTLTFNEINRHISGIVHTKIVSNKSPWLKNTELGSVYSVAVSHGEGRFLADENTVKTLFENGQVATQYVDLAGNPTFDIRFNPNGSVCAIEGITSPDGRIFGKMGHSER
ncbi:MAG: phosphoribosylformylglycinamidine synthase, partial [Defluviitaleaceae bacterium]|nr:phosphoribosylformylglycinamidine synthase [Defluviitaleaceae bacterium]